MRTSDAGMIAARENPNLVSRDFIRVGGRDFLDNSIHYGYYWNDLGVVTVSVLDLDTGSPIDYTFTGTGAIISVAPIVFVCEQSITVATQTIMLNSLTLDVINQIRGYDLHEQIFEVYQGDFDPETQELVAPAESVISGFVDTVQIQEPTSEDAGSITINVRSHTSEMTRTSTLKRTHAAEILRSPTDTFYQDTAVVAEWLQYWGQNTPTAAKTAVT